MKHNFPYLKHKQFLFDLDRIRVKEEFIKIISLDFKENPIEEIQGKVISGSLSIAGSSALRRTCSFNMVVEDKYEDKILCLDTSFSLNKKVDVLKGIKNPYKGTGKYSEYDNYDIFWFPLGIYVMTDLSLGHSADGGISISIQGKDKMCLLNGDVSGLLPAAVLFNEYDVTTGYSEELTNSNNLNGKYESSTQTNKATSSDAVVKETDGYNSLRTTPDFILSYTSEIYKPTIYMIIQELVNHFGGEQLGNIIISDVPLRIKTVMRWVGNNPLYGCEQANDIRFTLNKEEFDNSVTEGYTPIKNDNPGRTENGKFYRNDNIGFIYSDFTYPGELNASAGDSITSVLDNIVKYLGNFEYFYDVDGIFHFQEKKNYLNTTQAKDILVNNGGMPYSVDMSSGKSVYSFDDNMIVNSINSNPQYSMIKNDFTVWGMRKGVTGLELPIRYHLVIDDKPQTGQIHNCVYYEDDLDKLGKFKVPYHAESVDDFPIPGTIGLLYEANNDIYYWSQALGTYQKIDSAGLYPITSKDWRTELYMQGLEAEVNGTDPGYYSAELNAEWTKLYDCINGTWYQQNLVDLDYYLDFIDSGASITEFSVSNIGRREKIVTDTQVNCIFEPEIPDVVMIQSGQSDTDALVKECINEGQRFTQVSPTIYSALATGYGYYSAYSLVKDLLYQYTNYNETISLSTLPVYYLDTNVRITVKDIKTGVNGDYMVNSISIPLDTNSLMSISATKVVEKM